MHNQNNESFLSSNLNAAAFNYASDRGHSIIFKGLTEYNSVTGQACTEHSAEARMSYDSVMKNLETLVIQHEAIAHDATEVDQCLNLTAMDIHIWTTLSDSGHSLNSSNSELNILSYESIIAPGCSQSMLAEDFMSDIISKLHSPTGIFNCTEALPSCKITCQGIYFTITYVVG